MQDLMVKARLMSLKYYLSKMRLPCLALAVAALIPLITYGTVPRSGVLARQIRGALSVPNLQNFAGARPWTSCGDPWS